MALSRPSSLTQLNDYTWQLQVQIADQSLAVNLPSFVYYPVNRAVLDIPLRIRGKHTFDLLTAYDNALTTGANFRTFFEWFREREDLENEIKVRNSQPSLFESETAPEIPDPQIAAVRNALYGILPEFSNLTVRRNPLRMEIEKQGRILTVNQLSDGKSA